MTMYGPTPAFEEKKKIRDAGLMLSIPFHLRNPACCEWVLVQGRAHLPRLVEIKQRENNTH